MSLDTYALTSVANFKTNFGISGSTDDTLIENLINAATYRIEDFVGRKVKSRAFIEQHDALLGSSLALRNRPVTAVAFVGYGSKDVARVTYDGTANVLSASFSWTFPTAGSGAGTLTLRSASTSGAVTETAYSSGRSVSSLVTLVAAGTDPFDLTTIEDVRTDWIYQQGPIDVVDGSSTLRAPLVTTSQVRWDGNAGVIHLMSRSQYDWECDDDDDDVLSHRSFGSSPQSVLVAYTAGYSTVPYDYEQTCIELAGLMYQERKRDLGLSSESVGDYSYTSLGVSAMNQMLEERLGRKRKIR